MHQSNLKSCFAHVFRSKEIGSINTLYALMAKVGWNISYRDPSTTRKNPAFYGGNVYPTPEAQVHP